MEACKSDAEAHALVNALRRLSSLPVMTGRLARKARSPSLDSNSTANSESPNWDQRTAIPLSPKKRAILLADADSYVASILFKPIPVYRGAEPMEDLSRASSVDSVPIDPALEPRTPPQTNAYLPSQIPELEKLRESLGKNPNTNPYPDLPPSVFPSCSRAWATAAYLYVHTILRHMWVPAQPIDTNLLLLLLDRLRSDITRTEKAMRLGSYSSELWLWQVAVGAFSLTAIPPDSPAMARVAEMRKHMAAHDGHWGVGERGEFDFGRSRKGKGVPTARRTGSDSRRDAAAVAAMASGEPLRMSTETADSSADAAGAWTTSDDGDEYDDSDEEMASGSTAENWGHQDSLSLPELQAWFEARMGVWSRVSRLTAWEDAKKVLLRVAWLEDFPDEAVVSTMWANGVQFLGLESPFEALDSTLR